MSDSVSSVDTQTADSVVDLIPATAGEGAAATHVSGASRVDRATRSKLIGEQAFVLAGQLAAGLSHLAFAVVAVRLLAPDEFSAFAAFQALYLVVRAVVSSLIAGGALDPNWSHRTRAKVARYGVAIGIVGIAGSVAIGRVVDLSPMLVLLLAASVPSAGLFALDQGRLYGSLRHGRAVAGQIAGPVLRMAIGIPLAIGADAAGAALATVLGGYLSVIVVRPRASERRQVTEASSPSTTVDMMASGEQTAMETGRMARIGVQTTIGAFLLLALIQSQDVMLANRILDGHEAGRFAALSTLAGAVAFATATVPFVLLPRARQGRGALGPALLVSSTLGLLPALAVAVAPTPILRIVVGDRYTDAAPWAGRYVLAIALLGIARVLIASLCASHRWKRLVLTAVVVAAVIQTIGILGFSDNAHEIADSTLIATSFLVGSSLLLMLLGARHRPVTPAGAPAAAATTSSETGDATRADERAGQDDVGAHDVAMTAAIIDAGDPLSITATGMTQASSATDEDRDPTPVSGIGIDRLKLARALAELDDADLADGDGPADSAEQPSMLNGHRDTTSATVATARFTAGRPSGYGAMAHASHGAAGTVVAEPPTTVGPSTPPAPSGDDHDVGDGQPSTQPATPTDSAEPGSDTITRRRRLAVAGAVFGLTVAGLVIRLVTAGRSVWVDEAISITQAQLPFNEMLDSLSTGDVHPPMHNTMLWVVARLIGTDDLSMRLPSIIAGTLMIPMVYLTAKALFGRRAGFVAASLSTISPFMVWYSQEARMYGLVMLFGLIAIWAQIRVLDGAGRWYWAAYAFATAAMMWAHYLSCVPIAVQQVVFVYGWWRRRGTPDAWTLFRRWLAAGVGALVLAAPLVPFILHQLETNKAVGRITAGTALQQAGASVDEQVTIYRAGANIIWALWGFHTDDAMTRIAALWPLLMLLGLFLLGRGWSKRETILLTLIVLPALTFFCIGFWRDNLFEIRYFSTIVAPLLILGAAWIVRSTRTTIGLLIASSIVAATMVTGLVDQQVNKENPRVYDFDGALADVDDLMRPGDVFIYAPNYLSTVVNYYSPDTPSVSIGRAKPVIPEGHRVIVLGGFLDLPYVSGKIGGLLSKLDNEGTRIDTIEKGTALRIWVYE